MIVRQSLRILGVVFAAAFLSACQPGADEQEAEPAPETTAGEPGDPHVVDVTAVDFAFELPAEVPSGWTTLRMKNEGEQEHFLVLWRLPEGRTFEDYVAETLAPFRTLDPSYRAGEIDRAEYMEALGEALPEWFLNSTEAAGGPGLTAPGRTSETTVKLEPGIYAMECYVRTPEGEFHNQLGMVAPLTVTEETTGASPPEADVELTLSNYEIVTEGELTPGRQIVRVRFADTPEGLLPHDVHLARLPEGIDVEEAMEWMDWVDGFRAPAPAEFLGGAEHLPAGREAYLTVDLEPGRYVWLTEEYSDRGMVEELTVE